LQRGPREFRFKAFNDGEIERDWEAEASVVNDSQQLKDFLFAELDLAFACFLCIS